MKGPNPAVWQCDRPGSIIWVNMGQWGYLIIWVNMEQWGYLIIWVKSRFIQFNEQWGYLIWVNSEFN